MYFVSSVLSLKRVVQLFVSEKKLNVFGSIVVEHFYFWIYATKAIIEVSRFFIKLLEMCYSSGILVGNCLHYYNLPSNLQL